MAASTPRLLNFSDLTMSISSPSVSHSRGRSAPAFPQNSSSALLLSLFPHKNSLLLPGPRVTLRSRIPSGDLLYQKGHKSRRPKPVHTIENAKDRENAYVVRAKAPQPAMECSNAAVDKCAQCAHPFGRTSDERTLPSSQKAAIGGRSSKEIRLGHVVSTTLGHE
jgi:hypothetical protein